MAKMDIAEFATEIETEVKEFMESESYFGKFMALSNTVNLAVHLAEKTMDAESGYQKKAFVIDAILFCITRLDIPGIEGEAENAAKATAKMLLPGLIDILWRACEGKPEA